MKLKQWLFKIKQRIRLHRIARTLKIKPTKWQKEFALNKDVNFPAGRCNGKTTAVILRALVTNEEEPEELFSIFLHDPDFNKASSIRRFTLYEYMEARYKCSKKNLTAPPPANARRTYAAAFANIAEGTYYGRRSGTEWKQK